MLVCILSNIPEHDGFVVDDVSGGVQGAPVAVRVVVSPVFPDDIQEGVPGVTRVFEGGEVSAPVVFLSPAQSWKDLGLVLGVKETEEQDEFPVVVFNLVLHYCLLPVDAFQDVPDASELVEAVCTCEFEVSALDDAPGLFYAVDVVDEEGDSVEVVQDVCEAEPGDEDELRNVDGVHDKDVLEVCLSVEGGVFVCAGSDGEVVCEDVPDEVYAWRDVLCGLDEAALEEEHMGL